MITRRRLTALSCTVPLLLNRAARAGRPLRITMVNPGRVEEAFWIMVQQAMQAAAQMLSIELEVLPTNRDKIQMRDRGLSVIARADPPDALVIANEEGSAYEILVAASLKNLPVLIIVSDLEGAEAEQIGAPGSPISAYLGSLAPDNVMAGQHLANLTFAAARQLPAASPAQRIHLLAIGGNQLTPSASDRLTGLQAALHEAPDVIVDRILFADWSGSEAKIMAQRYIGLMRRSGLQPAAVWAVSDAMALGAMAAFTEAGYKPGRDVAFGGVNWSHDGVQAVADGGMAVTLGGHFFCGAWALVMLRDHFDGRGFEQDGSRRLRFPLSPVDAATAPRYLAVFGTQDWRRVDFPRFSRGVTGKARYDFSLNALLAATAAS